MTEGNGSLRFYGFLSHTNKQASLKTIRTALEAEPPPLPARETPEARIERITGIDVCHCPKCHAHLITLDLPKQPP